MVDETKEESKRPKLTREAVEEAIVDLKSLDKGTEEERVLSEADSTTTPNKQDCTVTTLYHDFLRFMDCGNIGFFPAALKSSSESGPHVFTQIKDSNGNLTLIFRSNNPTTPPLLTLFYSLYVDERNKV